MIRRNTSGHSPLRHQRPITDERRSTTLGWALANPTVARTKAVFKTVEARPSLASAVPVLTV